MALRKATVKQQMEGQIQPMLEPGEQERAAALCEGGPSRWWTLLSLTLVIFLITPYYIVATDRRVLFLKVSRWTGRPKGLLRTDPRGQVSIVDHAEHPVWSNIVYRTTDGSAKKLRYHRIWRDEMAAVIGELQAAAPAPGGAQPGSAS